MQSKLIIKFFSVFIIDGQHFLILKFVDFLKLLASPITHLKMKANPEPKRMNKVVTTFNEFRLGIKKGFSEEMVFKLRPER